MISLDEVVPEHHLVRKIDKHIDFTFIYDLVRDKYCPDNGRPGIDPVVLMKLVILQYIFGIKIFITIYTMITIYSTMQLINFFITSFCMKPIYILSDYSS